MREVSLLNETSALTRNVVNEESDTFTKIAFFGEYLGIVSDFYLYANFIDLVAGNDEDLGGLSYYGIIFGAIVAIASTYGTSLCQNKLNIHLNNLNPASVTRETGYHSMAMPQTETDQKPQLSITEKLLLGSNVIAKASDVASGPLFVIKLLSKNTIQKDIFFIINIIALAIGALCSVANTKSCYVAILALKKEMRAVEDFNSDSATIDDQESIQFYTPKSSTVSTHEHPDDGMEEPKVDITQSINNDSTESHKVDIINDKENEETATYNPRITLEKFYSLFFRKKPVAEENERTAATGYEAV